MNIKITLLTSTAKIPKQMSSGSAGYDLFSDNTEDIIIQPYHRVCIPTGIALAIPKGYEGQVRPRSGLAIKHGITVLNSPGTIDSDYRGAVKVVLINMSGTSFILSPGTRMAQLVIAPCESVDFELEEELDTTHRGDGGFGHTD